MSWNCLKYKEYLYIKYKVNILLKCKILHQIDYAFCWILRFLQGRKKQRLRERSPYGSRPVTSRVRQNLESVFIVRQSDRFLLAITQP